MIYLETFQENKSTYLEPVQGESQVTVFMKSRNMKEIVAVDRDLWSLGTNRRLVAV